MLRAHYVCLVPPALPPSSLLGVISIQVAGPVQPGIMQHEGLPSHIRVPGSSCHLPRLCSLACPARAQGLSAVPPPLLAWKEPPPLSTFTHSLACLSDWFVAGAVTNHVCNFSLETRLHKQHELNVHLQSLWWTLLSVPQPCGTECLSTGPACPPTSPG